MFWTVLAVGLGAHGWWSGSWIEIGFGILAGIVGVRRAVMQWDKPSAFANSAATIVVFGFLIALMIANDGQKKIAWQKEHAPPVIQENSRTPNVPEATPPPTVVNVPLPGAENAPPGRPGDMRIVGKAKPVSDYWEQPSYGAKDYSDNLEQSEPYRTVDFGVRDGEMVTAGAESPEIPFQQIDKKQCDVFLYQKGRGRPPYALEVSWLRDDGAKSTYWPDRGETPLSKITEDAWRLKWIRLKVREGSLENKSIGIARTCLKKGWVEISALPEDVFYVRFDEKAEAEWQPYHIPMGEWSKEIIDRKGCQIRFVKMGHFELDLDQVKNDTTGGWNMRVMVVTGHPQGLGYRYFCK